MSPDCSLPRTLANLDVSFDDIAARNVRAGPLRDTNHGTTSTEHFPGQHNVVRELTVTMSNI